MNERIRELKEQAFNFVAKQNMTKKEYFWENIRHDRTLQDRVDQKFAELIVEECRTVINDLYHKMPLQLAVVLIDADNEIMKHFYGVEE